MNALTIDLASGSSAEDQATSYVLKGLQFVGKNLASKYVRSKLNIVNPPPGRSITREDVENCKNLGRMFNYWREFTDLDIDAQECAEFVCGMSPIRAPSNERIAELADQHGISFERASEMMRVNQVQMAHAIISKHGHKIGQVLTWLADIEKLGGELETADCDEVETAIESALVEQYKRAADKANLTSKYVIESYAQQWEFKLPRWQDLLPTWGKATNETLETIQRRQAAYAESMAASQAEAERTMIEQYGDF